MTMLDNLGDLRRTHSCGELRAAHVGQTVTLMGWVARRRDFGPLTFFDLRDRDGITQVVLELSFPTLELVYELVEGLCAHVFREALNVELPTPFMRLTYAEAMRRYGIDKPDLRFEMELQDLAPALAGTTFAPFASALEAGGEVKGLVVRSGAHLSRKALDELQEFVRRYGAGA